MVEFPIADTTSLMEMIPIQLFRRSVGIPKTSFTNMLKAAIPKM
jgi:hypothetical protein